MSLQYAAVSWNRQKKVYDVTLVLLLSLYIGLFVGVGAWRNPNATAETLLIRGLGTAAFLLLNVVLCIGPLARLIDASFRCCITVGTLASRRFCWRLCTVVLRFSSFMR